MRVNSEIHGNNFLTGIEQKLSRFDVCRENKLNEQVNRINKFVYIINCFSKWRKHRNWKIYIYEKKWDQT